MKWGEERLGSKQWCYPHTGDALDLHCLAKLNVARKHGKKYPHFKDLKKPLTEMEKEELEIIKEAQGKKENIMLDATARLSLIIKFWMMQGSKKT